MANKSVLGKQDANSAGGSRHGFSLGQNFKFTMSTGMLLPAFSCFVNVGEQISGKPSFFIRADHLAAPVMGDVDVFVDCFFVPIRHLFAPFEQWLFQIEDNNTDLITPSSSGYGTNFPVFNAGSHPFAWFTATDYNVQNIFGGSVGFDLHRLLMHLGYNPQSLWNNLQSGSVVPVNHQSFPQNLLGIVNNTYSPNFPLYKLAAYQKIYYDYYRNSDYEYNNVLAYNFDSAYSSGSVTLTNLNNMPSTRAGLLELHYRDINKDYFTAIHTSPLYSQIGMLRSAPTLLKEMNNWLSQGLQPELVQDVNNINVSIEQTPSAVNIQTGSDERRWTGTASKTSFSGSGINYFGNGTAGNFQDGTSDLLHTHLINSSSIPTDINTATLRGMFAFDKLLRITQRAGKHVDDQTLAHFGYNQPAGVSGETYVLKSYHSLFHFGEVTSTAATNNADLGQMAGRGVAMLGDAKNFSFVAPCPGVFMAIISCAPRRVYIGAVEKDGFKVYLPDFFKPAIDDLGQQPLFLYETGQAGFPTDRCRWQYRWMEDKVKFDKASFAYATNDLNPWVFAYPAPYIEDTDVVAQAYRARFKVKPTDINGVFVNGYNMLPTYPNNTDDDDNFMNFGKNYLSDPFRVDFNMDFKRVSKMSIFGEPVLGGIC